MGEIKLLNDNLISQIAAGEVVERPANAIKELVENSIDAGAKNIIIEIEEGGKKLIKVSDDGNGIEKDDLEMAVMRHATSKIQEEKDLWEILSLGFRGEALSSIGSVSRVALKSRRTDSDTGYELIIEGGELINKTEIAMNVGTIVVVKDLFFNTPARRKFLKNDSTELSNISSILYSIALGHPEISFKLSHNGKVVFDLKQVSNFKSRIIDVYGESFSEALLPIYYGGAVFQMDGFIGKPTISRSNSKHQFFFVNGRFIRQNAMSALVKQAYHSMLMENKSPVFFINISINPENIDVNVHPKKTEIRFLNQQEIILVLYKMVKHALEQNNLMPRGLINDISSNFEKKENSSSNSFGSNSYNNYSGHSKSFQKSGYPPVNRSASLNNAAMDFSKSILGNNEEAIDNDLKSSESENVFPGELKVLTQLNRSYIVAEDNSELILIDQHAGHERVRYEELMDQYENQNKDIQILLIPQLVELRSDEKIIIEENLQVFKDLGFDIQDFGGNSFNVYSVPKFLVNEKLEEVIKGVIDDIINSQKASKFQGKTEAIITYMACRSAIKFGQKLSDEEMYSLIVQMKSLKRPYTCPHGRPTMVSLNMESLNKMFGRS